MPAVGNFLTNRNFFGGEISADIEFVSVSPRAACEIMVYYNPATRGFVTAGLGGAGMFSIRTFFNQWSVVAFTGDHDNLESHHPYDLMVKVLGSQISPRVDGVEVLQTQLPIPLPGSQVGVWCLSDAEIRVSNFSVVSQIPRIFVVMQFSSPFNEIYLEVIQQVCRELGLEPRRADEPPTGRA